MLPTGVTPVTAIPTFTEASDSDWARIEFNRGKEPIVTSTANEIPAVLERHISEAQNPHNQLDVAGVAIGVCSDFLDEGIVLVDTPGVGSTFLHNTVTAEAVLTECDAAAYLDKVQKLIPKIFFILNKVDLLNSKEKSVAQRFLADVLAERCPADPLDRIFALSAEQGLHAKLTNDMDALGSSGLPHLESVLGGELAHEKRGILLATGRQRLISLVGELLFQCDLERKALLTPQEELKRKAAIFETSVAEFKSERQRLGDSLAMDCKQLLKDLNAETDCVWGEARRELHQLVDDISGFSIEPTRARERITTNLSRYFAIALEDSVRSFQVKLDERLSVYRARSDALVNFVHQTAADLMEISVKLPRSDEAFQPRREPYLVAPEPAISLLDPTGSVAKGFLPEPSRETRSRSNHRRGRESRPAQRCKPRLDDAPEH